LARRNGVFALKTEVQPAYYLLANVQSGAWTVGLDTHFAKKAPVGELKKLLKTFYGEEA
jgi:hypothetical protein